MKMKTLLVKISNPFIFNRLRKLEMIPTFGLLWEN